MIKNEKLSIAVTGATGLLGQNVLRCLSEQGFKTIRILSRKSEPNCVGFSELITGDLIDDETLGRLVSGVDVVIHCAAELKHEPAMQTVNVDAVVKLAKISAEAGVKYFCHISSAGVIGPSSELVIDEASQCNPSNMYEKTKWLAEQELEVIAATTDLKVWMLRPTNVVDKDNLGVLKPLFESNWLSRLKLFFKGAEHSHIVYTMDVAAAAVYLATSNKAQPGIYFIGRDEDIRNNFSGLLAILNGQQGKKSLLETFYLPPSIIWGIRKLTRGHSLHPRAVFSSKKLLSTGFNFNFELDQIIKLISPQISSRT